MSTRAAIRPRPLDPNKQLLIVRELSELDTNDAQASQGGENGSQTADAHGHGHGHGHGQGQQKPKAIPIPDILEVETHYRDYLPLFSSPLTYLHGKGCGGNREPEPVEYDLDNEDEDWLRTYNIGRSRLNDVLFEKMLWKLELECAAATDNALTAAGAGPSERSAASAVAAIDHLPRQEAIRILMMECGGREKLCWDVYNYWAAKRKRWGKPILRRLQAPTLPSDTNPYNTFRPREKVNRPQTRRRRDNSEELMDKLRQLRDNLASSKQILEEVVRRERRKRDLTCTEVELLRIQYRSRHELSSHEQVSAEGLANLRERMKINGHADQIRAGMRVLPNKATIPAGMPPSKKIRSDTVLKCMRPMVNNMVQPPPAVEPEALWLQPANLLQIPLESKAAQRDRMDDVRRGRPAAFVQPGQSAAAAPAATQQQQAAAGTTAAARGGSGNPSAAAAAAGGPGASGAAAADGSRSAAGPAGDAAATPAPAAAAAAAPAAATGAAAAPNSQPQQQQPGQAAGAQAQQQQGQKPGQPSTAALPPVGPSAGPTGGRMNAVVAALHERQHLYKLPDGLANTLPSWRCFIGRGGRARLERIDHVTHESINGLKQEQMAIQTYYATEPWPPMPTAPLLREIVEKSRPPPRHPSGMHRAGSAGLASQASAGSNMMAGGPAAAAAAAAQRRASSANLGQVQQQPAAAAAAAGGAAAAGAAAPAAAAPAAVNGPVGAAPAGLQPLGTASVQMQPVQMPQQQHVQPQAQQAHTLQHHPQQPVQAQQQLQPQQQMQMQAQQMPPQQQQQMQPMQQMQVDPQQQQQMQAHQQQQMQMQQQGMAVAPAGMAAGQQQQGLNPMGMMPGSMPMQPQQQMQDPAAAQQQQQAYAVAAQQQQQMQQQQMGNPAMQQQQQLQQQQVGMYPGAMGSAANAGMPGMAMQQPVQQQQGMHPSAMGGMTGMPAGNMGMMQYNPGMGGMPVQQQQQQQDMQQAMAVGMQQGMMQQQQPGMMMQQQPDAAAAGMQAYGSSQDMSGMAGMGAMMNPGMTVNGSMGAAAGRKGPGRPPKGK